MDGFLRRRFTPLLGLCGPEIRGGDGERPFDLVVPMDKRLRFLPGPPSHCENKFAPYNTLMHEVIKAKQKMLLLVYA